MTLELLPAYDHFEDIRGLFLEYARWLAVPLEFQGFSAELDTLPGKYAPPEGRLYLALADGTPEGCVQGNVFGTYLHGLFDSGELTERLAELLCRRKGIAMESAAPITMQAYREQQFDLLADGVRQALDMSAVYAAMGLTGPKEERT